MRGVMDATLFIGLLLAHIIGDFYLQSDKLCQEKNRKRIKSAYLYVHALIMGVLAWVVVPECSFLPYALAVMLSHLLIDLVKTYSANKLPSFVIDQLAHMAVLSLISCFYVPVSLPISQIVGITTYSLPLVLLAAMVCMKPSNILIKLILSQYKVGQSESCEDIKNAGALIGNLERLLTVAFVLIGQYDAIGFIIAAKSILRFKETDTAKTEYVLAGTFLSFGFAIACGLVVRYLSL